jgi:hypothetical protein
MCILKKKKNNNHILYICTLLPFIYAYTNINVNKYIYCKKTTKKKEREFKKNKKSHSKLISQICVQII